MEYTMIVKEDIKDLLKIMPSFVKETYPDEIYTEKALEDFFKLHLEHPEKAAMIVRDGKQLVGFMCVTLMVDTFNQKNNMLIENMLYIKKKYRGGEVFNRLLKEFEFLAKNVKATRTLLTFPFKKESFERVEKIYKRKGYRPFEIAYVKEI